MSARVGSVAASMTAELVAELTADSMFETEHCKPNPETALKSDVWPRILQLSTLRQKLLIAVETETSYKQIIV